ncbi:hypothetical protein ACER0C_001825 [Sarotherodon galilaeus]
MPPKPQKKMRDIRCFLARQTNSPSGSSTRASVQPEGPKPPQGFTPTRPKEENDSDFTFKNLCVYGEKGITVAEALKRDGRFIDDLGYFELSNNQDPKRLTVCTQKEGIRVKTAVKETSSDVDTNKIYELLREQFPDLKRWMESRFPGDLYREALNLRKENFGKIQQSFSEVHRVRKLLELGKSVCKVVVKDVSMGTGFVLFDTFILTSAHLFKGYVEGKKLQQDVEVFAIFDYEKSEPETNLYYFRAENTFIDFDAELDYAVLELNPEGSKPNQQTSTEHKGYVCDSVNSDESVIEYAIPLLTIFENFVGNLKESENEELLKKVERAAKRNLHLKEILSAEEPMENY